MKLLMSDRLSCLCPADCRYSAVALGTLELDED